MSNNRIIARIHLSGVSAKRARELATSFANEKLSGQSYVDAAGDRYFYYQIKPKHWRVAVFNGKRWQLKIDPPAGVNIRVSFKENGSDPKLEEANFAAD